MAGTKTGEAKVKISGDSKGAQTAVREVESSLSGLGTSTEKASKGLESAFKNSKLGQGLTATLPGAEAKISSAFSSIGSKASSLFSKVGGEGESLGSALGKGALVAGPAAAGVAIAAFAVKGVQAFTSLASEIIKFQNVAGTSADASGRFVAVGAKFGVSADDMARGVGILNKTLGKNPEALTKYGVAIAHTKDGAVDVAATLGNVAKAYAETEDPTRRAALASTAFGKSYQTLIPLLKQGAGLGTQLAEVNKGLRPPQSALDAYKQMKVSLNEADESVKSLEVSVGSALIPTLADGAKQVADLASHLSSLGGSTAGLGRIIGGAVGFTIAPLRAGNDALENGASIGTRFKNVAADLTGPLGKLVGIHHSNAKAAEESGAALEGASKAAIAAQAAIGGASQATANGVLVWGNYKANAADAASSLSAVANGSTIAAADGAKLNDTMQKTESAFNDAADAVDNYVDAIHQNDSDLNAFLHAQDDANKAILDAAKAGGKNALANSDMTVSIDKAVDAARAHAKQMRDSTTATSGAQAGILAENAALKAYAAQASGPVKAALLAIIAQNDKLAGQHPKPTIGVNDQASGPINALTLKISNLNYARAVASVTASVNDAALNSFVDRLNRLHNSGFSIPIRGTGGTMTASAGGNYLSKNQPSIVGEKGWELFVPNTAGTVLSHSDSLRQISRVGAGSSSGGGTTIINFPAGTNPTQVARAQRQWTRRNGTS